MATTRTLYTVVNELIQAKKGYGGCSSNWINVDTVTRENYSSFAVEILGDYDRRTDHAGNSSTYYGKRAVLVLNCPSCRCRIWTSAEGTIKSDFTAIDSSGVSYANFYVGSYTLDNSNPDRSDVRYTNRVTNPLTLSGNTLKQTYSRITHTYGKNNQVYTNFKFENNIETLSLPLPYKFDKSLHSQTYIDVNRVNSLTAEMSTLLQEERKNISIGALETKYHNIENMYSEAINTYNEISNILKTIN